MFTKKYVSYNKIINGISEWRKTCIEIMIDFGKECLHHLWALVKRSFKLYFLHFSKEKHMAFETLKGKLLEQNNQKLWHYTIAIIEP